MAHYGSKWADIGPQWAAASYQLSSSLVNGHEKSPTFLTSSQRPREVLGNVQSTCPTLTTVYILPQWLAPSTIWGVSGIMIKSASFVILDYLIFDTLSDFIRLVLFGKVKPCSETWNQLKIRRNEILPTTWRRLPWKMTNVHFCELELSTCRFLFLQTGYTISWKALR